ncbi:MAG: hybrid sensor histidine kinase/response regulator [Magnetococcales bacterium]|nr:hybrid sensor histidine kinase/response regulator [Magnetococcales bacterium]
MADDNKARIMIVDDERLNINVLNEILKDAYQIKVALSGEQALQRAIANPQPDMVLLDIQMPGMNGYQVCQRLMSDPRTHNIPIIFITSLTEEEDEQKGLALGAVDYIAKPLRPSIILARIQTHLGLKKARQELLERNAELQHMLTLRESVESITKHDLKAPLNGILGVTQLLLEDEDVKPELKELVKLQERAGYNILEMINRSLDMLKMEQGIYQLHPKPVDLLQVIQRILQEVQQTSVNLLINGRLLEPKAQFIIQGEKLLCYSMLANLIKNAVEASPDGESLTILLDEGRAKTIRIHNQGVVPKKVRDCFFKKYASSGKQSGTGLGTYSAKLIAETLGGDIQMATSEQSGTTVTVTLHR